MLTASLSDAVGNAATIVGGGIKVKSLVAYQGCPHLNVWVGQPSSVSDQLGGSSVFLGSRMIAIPHSNVMLPTELDSMYTRTYPEIPSELASSYDGPAQYLRRRSVIVTQDPVQNSALLRMQFRKC